MAGSPARVTRIQLGKRKLVMVRTMTPVRKALQEAGFDYDSADQVMQPKNEVELSLDDARKVSKLIDNLDDLDDVQNIYSNWTASDEVMAQLDEE